MRRFNVAGPCNPERHYMLPPGRRLPGAVELVERGAYFALHAPRQTGKTTTMKVLARQITAAGKYAALYFTCEEARAFSADVGAAEKVVAAAIEGSARLDLPDSLRPPARVEASAGTYVRAQLIRWAEACPRPLVLIFDEIDAMGGDSLVSVLSQLRAGYDTRPAAAPWSVILCGMRDVRDYKAASGGGPVRLGSSSPFNIKEASLRLGNFTEAEVTELYTQHTADTGQIFAGDALARAFELTQGQPWLVNALAREVVEEMKVPLATPITAAHVDTAKERVIYARATHLDSFLARLQEDRVERVLEPILAGELTVNPSFDADFEYVVDLGLVAPDRPVRIANPIYREVVVRVLAAPAEALVTATSRTYTAPDGRLDLPRLLQDFAEFWRENGDILATRMPYPEVAPQLVLMAWLHGIVNGCGLIEREVGVGRKRIDVSIRWPFTGADGRHTEQREAIELKVWRDRDKRGDPTTRGLVQIDEYLAKLGLDEGTLVVFDARADAPPIEDRTRFEKRTTPQGRRVTLLRA